MMNASKYRDTKYEVRQIVQGPNSFELECSERGVYQSKPIRLEVHESLFTDEEMALVHSALELLETKFELAHDAKEEELNLKGLDVPREMVHALVRVAEEAKAQRAQIEAELQAKRAELEALEAEIEAKRAEVPAEDGAKRGAG